MKFVIVWRKNLGVLIQPLYCNFRWSFTMTNPLESEACDRVLHVSATSIGTLHIAPFKSCDSPFGRIVAFLKRRHLAISAFSSLRISLNSCGRWNTSSLLQIVWRGTCCFFIFLSRCLAYITSIIKGRNCVK